MIVLKVTQDKVLEALQSVAGIVQRRHTSSSFGSAACVSNGFPESGGGGASADVDCSDSPGADSTTTASSDDDDGGDADPEPARRRPHKHLSLALAAPPSGTARTATPFAGDSVKYPHVNDIALWRLPTVLAHVPVSRSGWWAGVKSGRFPQPVRISTRCVAWRAADIRALVDSL